MYFMISCEICGKQLKQITRNHLVRHEITVSEYRQKFPEAPLQDPSIIMSGRDNPFYGKKHSAASVEIMSEKARLRPINPSIGKQISEKWKDPNSSYRRMMSSEEYRQKMRDVTKSWWSSVDEKDKNDRFDKMRVTNTQNGRWLPPEDKDPFVAYRDQVRKATDATYMKHFYQIENARLRGKGYELDHIVSIREAFDHGLSVEVAACLSNIRIIPSSENKAKSRKSHMTCEMLLALFEAKNAS